MLPSSVGRSSRRGISSGAWLKATKVRPQVLSPRNQPPSLRAQGIYRRSWSIYRHDFRQLSSNAVSNSPQMSLDEDVVVTNACIKRIKALQVKTGKENLKLRLSVEGGGCSGFTYTFTMEDGPVEDDDKVYGREGAQVVVDEGSLEFVRGSTVDFTEDMMRSAFAVVSNPLSESACGCGSSFAMKNFEKNPAID
ncbi:iron-sulfur cluster assembly 2 mitochondrial-like protein [Nannochloropsis gaditana]|uniref:Iron-sulfur cluster assembly 2 mitochondrial-like protein n=1 Tax=Nannochloropsis gaditana TaxID=72520 RepID=W7UC88_9STRA|nr:iron-sulfur cluster assembly 2 mitochondrial-like protein [Nannochloropsis gaditana]